MAEVNLLKSIPYLLTAPSSRIWIDYVMMKKQMFYILAFVSLKEPMIVC